MSTNGAKGYQPTRRPPSFSGPISTARQMESGNHKFVFDIAALEDGGGTKLLLARLDATEVGASWRGAKDVQAAVRPLLAAWASDAALNTQYFLYPARFGPQPIVDPADTADEAGIIENAGWPLGYRAASRREALWVYESGLVVRTAWTPQDLDETTVPVSKAKAIANYVAAIRDPASRSAEEASGLDHFLGIPFGEVSYPIFPSNVHDDDIPAYDFPTDAPWDANFEYRVLGKPVWRVGVPTGAGFGGGQVDAMTGEVVRFHRVTRRWQLGPIQPPSPFTPRWSS